MRKIWLAGAAMALWPCLATSAPVKVEGGLLVGVAADTAVPVGIIKPSGKPDFAGGMDF